MVFGCHNKFGGYHTLQNNISDEWFMVEMEALQLREIRWNIKTVQAMVDGNIE